MSKDNTIYSVIERISISRFIRYFKPAAKDYFTPHELDELSSYTDQTWAGFLAVKRALIRLCNSIKELESVRFTELSFELTHDTNGAPFLSVFPDNLKEASHFTKNNFHISITHNRNNAIGLASFQR